MMGLHHRDAETRRERREFKMPGDINHLTEKIISAAIEIHRHLGPGLLESAYQECMCYELSQAGLRFEREVPLPVNYKGLKLDCCYRLDLVVEDAVVVEIKAAEALLPVHSAQLLTDLKAANKQIGLLINFNVPVLKNGIKRLVNQFSESSLRLAPRLGVSAVNRRLQ